MTNIDYKDDELFESSFMFSKIGKCLVSLEGRFLKVNPALCSILGYSEKELLSTTFQEITHPDDLDIDVKQVKRCIAGEISTYSLDKRYIKKNGKVVWAELNVAITKSPSRDDFFIVEVVNIQDRKTQEKLLLKHEASLRDYRDRLEIALDASQIGIWRWYPDEDKLEWDDRMFEIFGVDRNEFTGKVDDWRLTVVEEDRAKAFSYVLESVQKGLAFETEFRIYRKGEIRHIAAYGLHDIDSTGEVISMIGANYDITDLRTTEQNLIRSNAELEKFAYAASHDLKEPLRTIGGFATLLNSNHREKLDAQGQKFLDFILQGCQKMQSLIDSLLNYSKVDRKLTEGFQEVDMRDKAKKACEYLIAKISEVDAGVTWEEDLPIVWAHPDLMLQVVLNLVHNALKFRHPDRKCKISINWEDLGHLYRFNVIDNGIGIEEEYQEQIFSLFQRLHDRSMEGSGMGLALCKKIIGSFSGQIWVESEYGKGSKFSFTIPKGRGENEGS